jgi:hypothetical protein
MKSEGRPFSHDSIESKGLVGSGMGGHRSPAGDLGKGEADLPDDSAGSRGAEEAAILIAPDGRNWVLSSFLECEGMVCRVSPLPPA